MPYVFVNMAMTLDGKIAGAGREDFSLGTEADRREMDRLRAESDIVLWGGETLRAARCPARIKDAGLIAARVEGGLPAQPANGVITRGGRIPGEMAWYMAEDIGRFIFTSNRGAPEAEKAARGRAEVVALGGGEDVSPVQVIEYLEDRGLVRILIEGGGGIHWTFAKAGLVDALHVTVTPWLAGGASAPTLLDGEGFPAGEFTRLALEDVRREGDELFLRYRAEGK